MTRSRFVALLVLALGAFAALAPRAFAVKAIPLNCRWQVPTNGGVISSVGVFDDGSANYNNGANGVRCYFGVNARDVDLVTYNTLRKLHFVFDSSDPDVSNAGLSYDFSAEVDLFGVNYFGQFTAMGEGSTAQLQMDLEFHVPNSPSPRTFELDYSSLAVIRSGNTWFITSDPNDVPSGIVKPSPTAKLNEIRRRGSIPYNTVDMPIKFTVTLQ